METKRINPRVAKLLAAESKLSTNFHEIANSVHFTQNRDVLREARNCWDGLSQQRLRRIRNRKFAFPDENGQWSDPYEGDTRKTEAMHISEQGKTPLQHNMILPLIQTILGQFRGNQTEPVCTARDRQEQKIGEMMSIAVQYAYQLNDLWEMDGSNLLEVLISGICIGKSTYTFMPHLQKCDVRYDNKPLPYMFFNPMRDPRNWDCHIIGELHDMKLADVISAFSGGSRDKAMEIREIYSTCSDTRLSNMWGNMTSVRTDTIDFFRPFDANMCRVVEIWKMESKAKYYAHDTLTGEEMWLDLDQERNIKAENLRRTEEAARFQIEPKLINYKWDIHRFMYYRFMSPTGEVLSEGETPYWHGSHPYVMKRFMSIDGKAHSFTESTIDAQKLLNRNISMADFIINASSKGTLFVMEGTLPDGYTLEDLSTEYRKVGGVVYFKPNAKFTNGGIPQEIQSRASVVGVTEMIGLVRSLLPDLTGVHGALQGKDAGSGTSGKLYEAQANNAATNLVDTFETFKSFRTDRDKKMMQLIQQFYEEPVYLTIAGRQYSEEAKWYDPEKVRNADIDLTLSESTASINYRTTMDLYLMDLWKAGAITVKNMLSNSSLPFADKVLQSMESEEKEMAAQQQEMQANMLPQFAQQQNAGSGQLPPMPVQQPTQQ